MSANASLSCDQCGQEATALGDNDDFTEVLEQWERDHDLCGVEAEVIRWRRLAEEGLRSRYVRHNGDASKIMPMPRPSWASANEDSISASGNLCGTAYRSTEVSVAATHQSGWTKDPKLADRATVDVSAKLFGNGVPMVGIRIAKPKTTIDDVVQSFAAINLTVDEAQRLVEVLTAATELVATTADPW